jgi:hypothetical protein
MSWFLQRMRALYMTGVHHPDRYVRLLAMATIGQALALSCWRLHVRQVAACRRRRRRCPPGS